MSTVDTTISFEELMIDNDFTDLKVDNHLDTFETAIENLDVLFKIQDQIQKNPDISQESMLLLVGTVYNNLGISKDKTDYALEAFKSNNKELAIEGITDVIGKIGYRLQNLVNGIFGILENTWNKNIRGFRSIKKNISELEHRINSMGSTSKEIPTSSSIAESFTLSYKSNILKPDDVVNILSNHNKVADALFSTKDSLRHIAVSDFQAMAYVLQKAKTGDKTANIKSEVDVVVNNLIKLFDVSKRSLNIHLAEGKLIDIKIDEEKLQSYYFNKGAINISMTKDINLNKPASMMSASKSEANKILKELKTLVVQMENRTDTLFHISSILTDSIRSMLKHILASAVTLGFVAIGMTFSAFIAWIVSIFYLYYSIILAIITLVKTFSTKFSNVTYRAMDSAIEYIDKSIKYA